MSQCGTKKTHCCWFRGRVCQYVVPSQREGYIWDCSLRARLGSWDAVYDSPEYRSNVKPKLVAAGRPDINCSDYPTAGEWCGDCGLTTNEK